MKVADTSIRIGLPMDKTKTPGTQSLVPGVLLNYLGSKFL